MLDTYYLNHYQNEQVWTPSAILLSSFIERSSYLLKDTGLLQKCKENGVKCFLGYASNVAAFKAMVGLHSLKHWCSFSGTISQVSFPNSACNIAPFDVFMRGIVSLVPTHRLLAQAVAGKVPGYNFAFIAGS